MGMQNRNKNGDAKWECKMGMQNGQENWKQTKYNHVNCQHAETGIIETSNQKNA